MDCLWNKLKFKYSVAEIRVRAKATGIKISSAGEIWKTKMAIDVMNVGKK